MAEELNRETIGQAEDYDGSQIQVLEGLEAVRKRPGMYIGSTGPRGLHHLVYEIVDNSIDEALAGFCDHIEVTIKKGDVIEVSDNGRGIPVDIQPKLGIPAVTVVFTVLHAGGKFGGDNSGYKVAGGLHGVGASVVNALSEWLEVSVRRGGHEYRQSFKRGVADGELQKVGPAASSGTTVRSRPPSTTTTPCSPACGRRASSTPACASPSPTSGATRSSGRACATRAASAALWSTSTKSAR